MASAGLLVVERSSASAKVDHWLEWGKHYEIVNGQIVEEPPLGTRESVMASALVEFLRTFARTNRLGRVAGETLFILQHEPRLRRRPDVAYVSAERWSLTRPTNSEAAWDVVPDLAIEIVSPTDLANEIQEKIAEYFQAGVRLVWVFYVARAKVYVYESPISVRILRRSDQIDGGSVMPGFQVPLAEIFETDADESFMPGDE